jgi:uncharacterized protein (TIGR03435 family)
MDTDRFDISAKPDASSVSGPVTREQMQPMIRALLEDRFKLVTRTENKEGQVYALVPGKNGAKVPESQLPPPSPDGGPARGGRGPGGGPLGAGMFRIGNGSLSAGGAPMQFLADQLSRMLGRTVIDKTGLTGLRDFKLEWTPDESTTLRFPGLPAGDAPPPSDSKGPSLFTALEEQLGLRLVTEKGPVTNLVIEHIEKPSEN